MHLPRRLTPRGRSRQVAAWAVVWSVLVACSSTQPPDEARYGLGTRVVVCAGTSAERAAGARVDVEIRSRGRVLAADELEVPEQVVFTIPSSAPETRLRMDGVELASSPGGGGWGFSSGDGCPDGTVALLERPRTRPTRADG